MRTALALLASVIFVTPVLGAELANSDLANFNTNKAIKEAKLVLSKQYPQYSKSDLRLVEMAARYRPSESKNLYIEVSFINMDTIGDVKADPNVWSQPSTGREMPGLVYEHIVVKLESTSSSGGSVQVINMKYPGTKEELIDSMNNL